MTIRVMHVGLGPIGIAVAKQTASRRGFKIVAALDIDPSLAGRNLGELLAAASAGPQLGGHGRSAELQLGGRAPKGLRVPVTASIGKAIRATKPDVAVLCTSSSLRAVMPQFEEVLRHRIPIVTTTEEAAYPTPRNRRLAKRLDELAKRAKVAVLGTGVNPGFAMDALPIALTAACERVDRVEVRRVQDARIRRQPFQQKIGAGLTPAEFARRAADGSVRHVGFAESIQMIADALGWRLDRVTDLVSPKIADAPVASEFLEVEAGRVAGIIQEGTGYVAGEPRISLRLEAYLGAPLSFDSVLIEGVPRLYSKIDGGVHGDIATASMAVNAIPAVLAAPAGFRTMRDMRLPSYFGG